jgi:hypothetical protein
VDGQAGHQGGSENIDAFVDAIATDGLRAEQAAGGGIEEDFQGDGLSAGVISSVGAWVEVDGLERDVGAAEAFGIGSGAGGGELE